MFDRFRPYKRLIAAGLLVMVPIVLIATSDSRGVASGSASQPQRWGRAGLGWMRTGQMGVFDGLGEAWENLVLGDLAARNEKLRKKVARLREEKARLIGVLQENARLRKLVGFKRNHPEFNLAPARVVGRDVSPYFRVLNLKLKTDAEVEQGMPVVAAGGIVGQVHRTYGAFADVIIVADPRSRIDVISQRNRAHGVVQGQGNSRNYAAKIAYLRREDQVREGDVMVTSGMGGVFPPELVVGRVTKLTQKERGLFQRAILEPAVDYSRLKEVFIIQDAK